MLAAIAARLPLSAGENDALRSLNNESGRLLDLLQDDRWVESNRGGVTAAHDIFTDAIVARYIFGATGTITDRVGDVLSDAVDGEAFDRALIALNRLAAHKSFGEIDGLRAIRRTHARRPEPVIAARELLLKTRLPDERACIRILAALADVADAVAADMSCDGPLSYLAEATAKSKDERWRDEAASILPPFLDRAVDRPNQSNMIVRRSLRLLPARYRDQALARVRREPARLETHFLFVAWLRSRLPVEEIAADVEVWLYCGGAKHSEASFVFRAWLDAAAKLDPTECAKKIAMVEPHVRAWLQEHRTAEAAGFVFPAWLDAAAKLDPTECAKKIAMVEPHVRVWLQEHGTAENGQFVYKAWLDAAAKLDPTECAKKIAMVEPHVRAWLDVDKHRTTEAASFVFPAWLDAAAKLDPTECAKKIAMVEPHLRAWLDVDKHRTTEAARFVYEAWLDAATKLDKAECKEKIEIVEPHVLAWLDKLGTAEAAQFMYMAWLNAGGSPNRIRGSLLKWLRANLWYQQTDFIIKAWLEATRDFATVRVPALAWLKRNTKNPDAVFVLKFITKDHDLPSDAIEDVILWCRNFPDNMDAICRVWPVLSRFATRRVERPLTDTALLVLQDVQMDWLADKGVRAATLATLGDLVGKARFRRGITPAIDSVHAEILRQTKVYATPALHEPFFALNPTLAIHVGGMLDRGVLTIEKDLTALETFADWLASWPEARKTKLLSSLQLLERVCPVPGLWTRVYPHVVQAQELTPRPRDLGLEELLIQLSDLRMNPRDWSDLWEKTGWNYFPGEPPSLRQSWIIRAKFYSSARRDGADERAAPRPDRIAFNSQARHGERRSDTGRAGQHRLETAGLP